MSSRSTYTCSSRLPFQIPMRGSEYEGCVIKATQPLRSERSRLRRAYLRFIADSGRSKFS